MHKLTGNPLKKLIPLLKNNLPDCPITLGVLDGTFRGCAYTDDPEAPSKALVLHEYAGFIQYLGAEPCGTEIDKIAAYALGYKSGRDYCNWVEFAFCPKPVAKLIREKYPDMKSYDRISWTHDVNLFSLAPLPVIPEECEISLLGKKDFSHEFLRFETMLFWESTDEFLKTAMGTVAFDKKGNFLGVCGAVSDSDDFLEINIEVDKNNRKKGIGYAIAHRYIKECYSRGKKPHWDCYHYNSASKALARKLGFTETDRYPLVSWTY